MKISLEHEIFLEDPYAKFSEIHQVPKDLWNEMYHKRYLWYQYEVAVLAEYFNLRTGKNLNERTIRRWIKRTDVYNKGQKMLKLGTKEVTSEFFEDILSPEEASEMFTNS